MPVRESYLDATRREVARADRKYYPRVREQHSTRSARPMIRHIEVLLVDDDPAVRGVFARVLRQAGLVVTPVGSGDAAIELLRAGRSFDVVVSDLLMPGLSGAALLQRLRQLVAPVSIIGISGDARALRAVEAAGFRCLTKPIDNDELVAAVVDAAATRASG